MPPLITKHASYLEFINASGPDGAAFDEILTGFIMAHNHDAGVVPLQHELTMLALPEEEVACPMLRVEYPAGAAATPMELRDAFLAGLKQWMASRLDTFEKFKELRAVEKRYKFIFRRRSQDRSVSREHARI